MQLSKYGKKILAVTKYSLASIRERSATVEETAMSHRVSRRRGLVPAAILAATALFLAACGEAADGGDPDATASDPAAEVDGAEGEAASDGGVIGVSVADQRSLFYISAVNGMRAEAEEQGYELRVLAAQNDSTAQVSHVQDLVAQGVGALIFTPQDATAASAGVLEANAADIPVVAVDQRPETDEGELATYIATDSVQAARELCTWAFEQMGGSGNIAILQGVLGSTAEIQRTQGCEEALEEFPDVEVVAMTSANWDETEAFNASQNILTANPDLDAIFGESDAMAMGAAKAAEQAGRDDMLFFGIDGFPTMFDEIENGLVHATMAQQPYMMGQLAVRDAVALIEENGEDIPELQYQDTVLVTQENIDEFSPEDFYGEEMD
jgi:ribose transport system substrate-binding protein